MVLSAVRMTSKAWATSIAYENANCQQYILPSWTSLNCQAAATYIDWTNLGFGFVDPELPTVTSCRYMSEFERNNAPCMCHKTYFQFCSRNDLPGHT